MKPIVVIAALTLAGCTTTRTVDRPVITTVEVPVPVASPCVPATLSPAPDYPDGSAAAPTGSTGPERYQNTLAGRLLRIARLNELETVVAGCPKESK